MFKCTTPTSISIFLFLPFNITFHVHSSCYWTNVLINIPQGGGVRSVGLVWTYSLRSLWMSTNTTYYKNTGFIILSEKQGWLEMPSLIDKWLGSHFGRRPSPSLPNTLQSTSNSRVIANMRKEGMGWFKIDIFGKFN